ncbi:hypothetical protein AB0424_28550 [Streptomyces sp. NPDC051180]|uniref:hypothetical protein n=1 Tax=unclassified Streptomyces TaxID=2593676 RepID=UPI003450CE90
MTAALAAQDGPDGQGAGVESSRAPTAWEPEIRDVMVKDLSHVLTGGWVWISGDPGWRFFTRADYDPDCGDTTVTTTYSDGEVVREDPWPEARLVYSGPTPSPRRAVPDRPGW